MVSYTRENISKIELTAEEQERMKPFLTEGVAFPGKEDVAHGSYPLTAANYLSFSAAEHRYDIPLLGLIYYHLERESFPDKTVYRKMQAQRPVA